MTAKEQVRLSKLLSLVLRHKPDEIGIKLDEAGWVSMSDLLAGLKTKGYYIGNDVILDLVATNEKRRFETKSGDSYIRASQGHSVEVELGYENSEPPEFLYHGTATGSLDSIFEQGLKPGSRQHVHLSGSYETAEKVGSRHGKPIVLKIPAKALWDAGTVFYHTPNDVWLVGDIPATALTIVENFIEE